MKKSKWLGVAVILMGGANAFAVTFVADDFELSTTGILPGGWSDVGQVPGTPTNPAPNPSTVAVNTTDAFGQPTRAASIVNAMADSQGIYQTIPTTASVVGISVDVRIDQYASVPTGNAADWAWDIGLVQTGQGDFAQAPSYGVYASALTQKARTFTQGYSNGFDDQDLGGPTLATGVWYNLNIELDRNAGTIQLIITDIAANSQVLNGTSAVAGWQGFGAEPQFDAVAFFDGELTATVANNLTLFDNIIIADRAIPITLPTDSSIPEPMTGVLGMMGLGALATAMRRRTA